MLERPLVRALCGGDDRRIGPLITHHDVTTIMRLLGEIRFDLAAIRGYLLEEDDGEEEEDPEADG